MEQSGIVEQLRRLGLAVYVADPVNFEQLFTTIEDIGKITGKFKAALNLIVSMKKEISEVSLKVKEIPFEKRVKVFIEVWHEPLMTAAKGSFIDELIELS